MSWVRIPPEQHFFLFGEKELFGLVAFPFFLFIEKSFHGVSYFSHFRISRCVQQGFFLSTTFFLVVLDKLLFELNDKKAGISIYDLYLGGAAHADDVRSIATSANTAKEQSLLISDFAFNNGLTLNMSKIEVVKMSRNPTSNNKTINLSNISVPITVQTKCLGYMWSKSLSARAAVENNIARACRQFFALESTCSYLGHSNPLSARIVVETCVIPTLLYGAENWILVDTSLNLLEMFQAVIGRRILRLSRFHSQYSVLVAMSWPSMVTRTLKLKLGFLFYLLASEDDNIASSTFHTLASQDVYSLGIVQQCFMLDSKIGTQSVATILNTKIHSKTLLKGIKKDIMIKDKERTLQEVALHPSIKLAANINWLCIWDAV